MINQEYINQASEQRKSLLQEKSKLGFFGKLFFRSYTDWVITNEVGTYEVKTFESYYGNVKQIGQTQEYDKQTLIRMRLNDGELEVKKVRI